MNQELLQILVVALLVAGSGFVVVRGAWRSVRAMHAAKAGACGGCNTCGGCPSGRD